MSRKSVVLTTVGTLSCAFGIGYVMQMGSNVPETSKPLKPVPVAEVALDATAPVKDADNADVASVETLAEKIAPAAASEGPLDLDAITLTSVDPISSFATLAESILNNVAFEEVPEVAEPADQANVQLNCDVIATAKPAPSGNVVLSVDAPCNGNERVTVHHTGMMFTQTTSDKGAFDVTVPALSDFAIFVIDFDSGAGAVVSAEVPGFADYDRVALQWTGDAGFQIHAREFGAAYGAAGHVWSGSELDAAGQVIQLGDATTLMPNLVEIYTFPTGLATEEGTVDLTVEAEVTPLNCGRDIAAQSIELRGSNTPRTQDLVLSMPDCSAVGDFLVLNNLVDDLKIAAR